MEENPKIEVPDTVEHSSPFRVEVTTYGDGCVRRGETEAEVQGSVAVVTSYDYRRKGGVCPAILVFLCHEAPVSFAATGTVRVVIRGREERSGQVIRVEGEIIVREGRGVAWFARDTGAIPSRASSSGEGTRPCIRSPPCGACSGSPRAGPLRGGSGRTSLATPASHRTSAASSRKRGNSSCDTEWARARGGRRSGSRRPLPIRDHGLMFRSWPCSPT